MVLFNPGFTIPSFYLTGDYFRTSYIINGTSIRSTSDMINNDAYYLFGGVMQFGPL